MGSPQSATVVTDSDDEFKRISLLSGHRLRLKPASIDNLSMNKDFKEGKAFQLLADHARKTEQHELENHKRYKSTENLKHVPRQNVGDRVATLGSQEDAFVYSINGDIGLFASVLTAYNYHWTLRTSPDDWWFSVIKKVAKVIDKNAKKDAVRKFFVDHEGKKTLTVEVNTLSIYGIDYGWFFDEMSRLISENVKVPGYVDAVTADFSTTTAVQRIVSQVTLMSSVQEFFDFRFYLCCGIPEVELLGTEKDWEQLLAKAKTLRKQLEPIKDELFLSDAWWDMVEQVFSKLLETYQGNPDATWWSHILSWKKAYGSGPPSGWEGWIVDFLERPGTRQDESAFDSGLATVPLIIEDLKGNKDTAALVAGMLGFTVHQDQADRPSVRPFQGWSLLLPEKSPFRRPLEE